MEAKAKQKQTTNTNQMATWSRLGSNLTNPLVSNDAGDLASSWGIAHYEAPIKGMAVDGLISKH